MKLYSTFCSFALAMSAVVLLSQPAHAKMSPAAELGGSLLLYSAQYNAEARSYLGYQYSKAVDTSVCNAIGLAQANTTAIETLETLKLVTVSGADLKAASRLLLEASEFCRVGATILPKDVLNKLYAASLEVNNLIIE